MALVIVAGAPIVPLSPTPLKPPTLHGEGVSMLTIFMAGVSYIPGTR